MSALHAAADDALQAQVQPSGATEQFRCSLAQQRFWILEQLDPGTPALNVAVRWRLEGKISHDVLERAWRLLIERHQVLRTAFVKSGGEPLQVIAPVVSFAIPAVDLTRLSAEEADREAVRLARQEARVSFNPAIAPLIRVTRLQLPQDVSILLVTAHHLICDGWSIGILAREMGEICAAYQAGRAPALREPALCYGDYAEWQHAWLAETPLADDDSFWIEALDGVSYFEVRPDHPRPPFQTVNSEIQSRLLDRNLTDSLTEFARLKGSTLFMTALAGLLVMLHRQTGDSDIAVGTQVAGRDEVELENVVGLFINTLVLRTELGGDPCFAELMERVRAGVTGAFEHRQMPFERLIQRLNPGRDLSRNALFSVNFIFQRSFIATATYDEFRLVDLPSFSAGALYDLNFFMVERPEGWRMSCEHNADLFDAGTIEGLLQRWEQALRAALRAPQLSISALPILSEADRLMLVRDWNRTEADYPRDRTFVDLLALRSASDPASPAVTCGEETLTYGELEAGANRLARELRHRGSGPGKRIGVLLERSVDLLVALLAVMKSAAAYVPLDPRHPRERLRHIAESAGLAGIVTRSTMSSLIDRADIPAIQIDADRESIEGRSAEAIEAGPGADDLAYVIHTSGSTGRPKGVAIRHRSLLNLLCAMGREPGLDAQDRLLAVTTVGFDIAALELFLPLLMGARVILAKEQEAADGQELLRLLRRHRVTVLQATPARWQILIDAGWEGDPPLRMFCGGESMSRRLANELLRRGDELWNLYGPTETTIWSSAQRVSAAEGSVAIGPPIANTRFYVLDEHGELVPPGGVGELYIGGDGVAAGYLGMASLSEERFLPDGFSNGAGAKLYRTGDIMRWRSDRTLEFLGRSDRQIKLRGYRIEPAEIEQVLCRHPDIAEAAVVMAPQASGQMAIAAHVLPRHGSQSTPAVLVGAAKLLLGQFLPDYMHPSSIQVVNVLPRTPSGKIDLRALVPQGAEEPVRLQAPRALTATERRLARIWKGLLGLEEIDPAADFFDLGGNSVLAARLLALIGAEFGRSVSLAAMFRTPRLEDLAQLVQHGRQRDLDFRRVVKLHPNGRGQAIVALNNTGIFYELCKELGPDQPFTALQAFDPDHAAGLAGLSFEEIAAAYVRLIREVQPRGPYVLLGWCIGGALAFEAAHQLAEEGEEVPLVVLADGWVPGYLRRMARPRAALAETSYRIQMLLWNIGIMASGRQSMGEFMAGRHLLQRIIRPFGAAAAGRAVPANLPRFLPENYEQELHSYLTAAVKSYDPKPFPGHILLLRSAQQPTGFFLDDRLGWSAFARGGVEALTVPGDHFTMLRYPGIREIAPRIRACLESLLGSSGKDSTRSLRGDDRSGLHPAASIIAAESGMTGAPARS